MSWQLETTVSDEQVRFYEDNGYLKFGRIFTEVELNALREYVDKMIENLPEGRRPEQMDVPHFEHPYLFKYLTHPRCVRCDCAIYRSGYIALVESFYQQT